MRKIACALLGVLLMTACTPVPLEKPQEEPVQPDNDSAAIEDIGTFPTDNLLDTSDWLTYRNEEWGFEVRYPGEFNVTKSGYQPGTKGSGVIVQLENYVRDETSDENISTFGDNEVQINFVVGSYSDCEKLGNCGTIVPIGNISAARNFREEGMHGPSVGYIFYHNGQRFSFGYLPADNASAPYAETIIHSLRFFK